MTLIRKNIIRFLCLSAAFIIAAGSPAQAEESRQYSKQAAMQTKGISDATIQAYASSAIQISEIHSVMAPKIQAAKTENERNAMYVDMQDQMADVLEKTDNISLDEYNTISEEAQKNPKLAERIRTELHARYKQGG